MNKKKLLGLFLVGVIGVTSAIPAFADTTTNTNLVKPAVQTENAKQGKHNGMGKDFNKINAENYVEKAEELGIDISGLSQEEAIKAVKEALKAEREAKFAEDLQAKAEELGIDISGLSQEEAIKAVKEAMRANGKEVKVHKGAINADNYVEKAEELGVDISGLSQEEAIKAVKEALKAEKGPKFDSEINNRKHKGQRPMKPAQDSSSEDTDTEETTEDSSTDL